MFNRPDYAKWTRKMAKDGYREYSIQLLESIWLSLRNGDELTESQNEHLIECLKRTVKLQSNDQSINILDVKAPELFQGIKEVAANLEDKDVCKDLNQKIEELEAAQGTSNFIGRYQEFMALAANHMTVFAPFLPALAQMLR